MNNLFDFFNESAESAKERLLQVHEDRILLRSLLLEEAENQGEETKTKILEELDSINFGMEDECERLQAQFETEINQVIQDFYIKSISSYNNAVQHSLLLLGEDSRRQIEAKLVTSRKDELKDAVKKDFYVFNNIAYLDDRAIQKILRSIDTSTIGMALKLAELPVKNKIFRNMSKKAATLLKEDIEFMGAVYKKDIYEAQDKIVKLMIELEEKGEIVITINKGDFENIVP